MPRPHTPHALPHQSEGSTTMRLVVGCCDNNVHLYRNTLSSGSGEGAWVEDKRLPQVHGDWVRDVAWVPSGGMPYNMFASCSEVRRPSPWTPWCLALFIGGVGNHARNAGSWLSSVCSKGGGEGGGRTSPLPVAACVA